VRPWSLTSDGLVVSVRLTPRAGRDEIAGIEQRADGNVVLKVRVRAAAVEGAANDALIRLIAGTLGVARSTVALVAGQTARVKRLKIAGEAQALAARLESCIVEVSHGRKDH
jgi:uncharacterized protein